MRHDLCQLALEALRRAPRLRIQSGHYSVHQSAHRPYSNAVHETTLGSWASPGFRKGLPNCPPVSKQDLLDSFKIRLTRCDVAVWEETASRGVEADLYHGHD